MEINLHNFKYSLIDSRLLHDHLMSILETNNYEQEHLPEKVMQYIGMIVESEKNPKISEDFFEYPNILIIASSVKKMGKKY